MNTNNNTNNTFFFTLAIVLVALFAPLAAQAAGGGIGITRHRGGGGGGLKVDFGAVLGSLGTHMAPNVTVEARGAQCLVVRSAYVPTVADGRMPVPLKAVGKQNVAAAQPLNVPSSTVAAAAFPVTDGGVTWRLCSQVAPEPRQANPTPNSGKVPGTPLECVSVIGFVVEGGKMFMTASLGDRKSIEDCAGPIQRVFAFGDRSAAGLPNGPYRFNCDNLHPSCLGGLQATDGSLRLPRGAEQAAEIQAEKDGAPGPTVLVGTSGSRKNGAWWLALLWLGTFGFLTAVVRAVVRRVARRSAGISTGFGLSVVIVLVSLGLTALLVLWIGWWALVVSAFTLALGWGTSVLWARHRRKVVATAGSPAP